MMKVFLVENINDIHDEFVREACARLDRKIWDLIGFSTRFISMESCLEQITNYIVKLERENFGLKEYKNTKKKRTREDIAVVRNLGTEGQLSQRRSRWTK